MKTKREEIVTTILVSNLSMIVQEMVMVGVVIRTRSRWEMRKGGEVRREIYGEKIVVSCLKPLAIIFLIYH